jgi:carboxypeptidase C (cathepsin A)
LRVFVSLSYFDLNAPFHAQEFTLAHIGMAPEVRARRVSVGYYEAGQMAYIDPKAAPKLRTDLAKFIRDAAAAALRPE